MIHHISIAAQNPPNTVQQLEQIGRREGWQVALRDRGVLKVVEFWLENQLMLEFMPPELGTEYLQFMQPHIAQQVFGQPIETALA
jgi:hypothetical protein